MMPFLAIPFPDIDPVAFSLGPLEIRWYGICWMLGFLTGWAILRRLCSEGRLGLNQEGAGDFLVAAMLGTVLGGRLGYALFYNFEKYSAAPLEIFKVWEGGLSFHGGVIGLLLAIAWFVRRRRVHIFELGDAAVLAATPGIFLVRCANFINGELWGRRTDVAWGIVFPEAGPHPRHPSQLYEGLLEGLLLGAVLWFLRSRAVTRFQGRLSAVFLVGYAVARFLVEFVREPDSQLGLVLGPFSMGQILSAAMLFGGVVVWVLAGRLATPARGHPHAEKGTGPTKG